MALWTLLFQQVKALPTPEVFAKFFPDRKLGRDGKTHCVIHQEKTPSLNIYQDHFFCFGCQASGDNVDLLVKAKGLKPLEAAKLIAKEFGINFDDKQHKGGRPGAENAGTVEQLTVEKLAVYKKLPEKLLRDAGLRNAPDPSKGVVIPYFSVSGELGAVQYRLNTDRDPRFRWASGARTSLYGLDRLEGVKKLGWILLVEGPSDCWTSWHYGLPAIGAPSKTIWRKEWAEHLLGISVYLWQEPGAEDFTVKILADVADVFVIEA